jgi:hypothetical protein
LGKATGKVTVLERKLEEKEDYIAKLKAERHTGSDAKISEKFKLLEQEVLILE